MEDSFRVRVNRVFGSLDSSSSSSLPSLWSLTDEEVERKEWNRGNDNPDREETPCSSSFDGFFAKEKKNSERKSKNRRKALEDDLGDLDDDDDEDELQGHGSSNQSVERDDCEREEWEIRSSIGLDCTLDNEEEEDEFDKVAVGKENAGDRLYMKDVNDYGAFLNSHNVLPSSFKDVSRDPRASHLAARVRLKEDEAVGASSHSFSASDKTIPAAVDSQVSEGGGNLKSILKRKEHQRDSRSQKRVRFDPGCEDNHEELEEAQKFLTVTGSMEMATVAEDCSLLPQNVPEVPDYIRNPSKYTCYSFDTSSEVDEESNRRAYMDLVNMMKSSSTTELQQDGTTVDLSKSITFIPRKKASNVTSATVRIEFEQNQEDTSKEPVRRAGLPLGIAVEEAEEGKASVMDEDEPETVTADKSSSSRKLCRQYRTKVSLDDFVP